MSTPDETPLAVSQKRKWSTYGIVTAIILTVSLAMWALSGFITYPTEAHRTTAVQLSKLSTDAVSEMLKTGTDPTKAYESKEYKALESSSEARYSSTMNTIVSLVQFVVFIGMIAAAFRYLRDNQIAKRPVLTVSLLSATACTIMLVFTVLLASIFYPTNPSEAAGVSVGLLLAVGLPMTFILTALITALIARIFQWLDDRKANKLAGTTLRK